MKPKFPKSQFMLLKSLAISFLFTLATSFANPITSGNPFDINIEPNVEIEKSSIAVENNVQKMDDFISGVYAELQNAANIPGLNEPSFEVFRKALIGHYNLINEKKVENQDLITIIDFSLPSNEKRLWIINLNEKKILFNDLVAHGRNSGNVFAEKFSNVAESHMSSQGFYVTGNTYFGKHGLSLRLNGMEQGINDKAFERAIVMHGADYVSEDFIKNYGRLGRSYGCPSVSNEVSGDIINTIKNNTCLFIYSPALKYDENSSLLDPVNAANFFGTKTTI